MKKPLLLYGILFLAWLSTGYSALGQVYPSTVHVQLKPPHSRYLSDYYAPTADNLKVTLVFNDYTEPFWEIKLRMRIESSSVHIQTVQGYTPQQPITMIPGVPLALSGPELENYFDYRNINLQGISVQSLQQNGRLPEGLYTFCFEVLDYNTGKVLSRKSCANVWLTLSDPPRIISPACGATLSPQVTQHNFQWQLFNTPVPNAAGMEYKLFVYEMPDPNGNPLTALTNGNFLQVFESDYLQTPYFLYDLAAPLLEPGKRYFYRVQAIDPEGKTTFKNHGFSEVCSFYYGYPENGTIKLVEPAEGKVFESAVSPIKFQWEAPNNKQKGQAVEYLLEIVKKRKDQTGEEAFRQNDMIITKKMLPTISSEDQSEWIYHFDIPDSMDCAWRVRAYANNREIAKSAIGSFMGFSRYEKTIVKNSKKGDEPDIIEKTLGCPNAGVEENNFTNWTGLEGGYKGFTDVSDINSGLTLNPVTLGTSTTDKIVIVQKGQDDNVPIQKVYQGKYAIRIGNSKKGNQATRVVYNLQVDNDNMLFKYNYAVVLVAGHGEMNQNPFFSGRIIYKDEQTDALVVICETGRKTSGEGDNFFKKHINGWEYRNWDCASCDLSSYEGKVVQVEFTVTSCDQSEHPGYAYIDGLCDEDPINLNFTINKNIYCPEEDIILDGSNTIGATSFVITMEESDANWGRPNASSERIWYFKNQSPGKLNLTQLANSPSPPNFSFKCNTYYRIKLAVSNGCVDWKEDVKLIYIQCPDFETKELYCLGENCQGIQRGSVEVISSPGFPINPISNLNELRIGPKNPKNYTYTWSPSTGLSANNVPNPIHTIGSVSYPFEYTVTATDNLGCSVSKKVKINCPPKAVRFSQTPSGDCCGTTRLELTTTATAGNYNSITWSNGAKNVDYIDVTESGTYSVTVSNECGSYTSIPTNVTTNKDKYPRYWINLSDENHHSFYSSGTNQNSYNAFYIMHVEDPKPPYGEYYATEYKLEIYYKWGQMGKIVREITGKITNCQGFSNPAIFWDGKNAKGQNVQEDVYTGKLFLKNCRYGENWMPVKVTWCDKWKRDCLEYNDCKWYHIFGESCSKWTKKQCVWYSGAYCIEEKKDYAFPITILR